MARKDLLRGLMGAPATPGEPAPAPAPAVPRVAKGAIGAVSKSIGELRARSVIEVPSDMIDAAGVKDRLDAEPEGIAALAASIRDYGQQVPVLLRHSPNYEGRYEVIYGRRRVAALKSLGQPVKAIIRNLNDRELIIAQGQENAARRDLSFIEKVNFAREMREGGFERQVICDALHVDKTLISRMLSVADAVPARLVRAIGAAPSVGRDRWMVLAAQLEGVPLERALALAVGEGSDARFEAVLSGLRRPAPAPDPLPDPDPAPMLQVSRSGTATVLRLDRAAAAGFDDWLVENLERLHAEWRAERDS